MDKNVKAVLQLGLSTVVKAWGRKWILEPINRYMHKRQLQEAVRMLTSIRDEKGYIACLREVDRLQLRTVNGTLVELHGVHEGYLHGTLFLDKPTPVWYTPNGWYIETLQQPGDKSLETRMGVRYVHGYDLQDIVGYSKIR